MYFLPARSSLTVVHPKSTATQGKADRERQPNRSLNMAISPLRRFFDNGSFTIIILTYFQRNGNLMNMDLEKLKLSDEGLLPVIVQDSSSGRVLMLAYANKEALEMTVRTGRTHFWSRSRKKIWNKGEESGHFQDVKEIFVDCDCDTVLITVEQTGVACHTGEPTCFYRSGDMEEKAAPVFEEASLRKVFSVIEDRKQNPREGSYVSGLMKGGIDRILKKIGEEAGEVIIAAKNTDKDELVYELADLWFHSMVLLCEAGLDPQDISDELERRFGRRKEEYAQKK